MKITDMLPEYMGGREHYLECVSLALPQLEPPKKTLPQM